MTAVEYLLEQIRNNKFIAASEQIEVIDQAKEMEKQQIIDFADSYGTYLLVGGTMSAGTYNETFKNTK